MSDCNYDNTWYHGSPLRLETLRQGSTITQNRRLAEAFSHKPPRLSISDDGEIKHNGVQPGFLYSIDEEIGPGDITPHPRSTMGEGLEWLINRELRVKLVGPVPISLDEVLTEEEIRELEGME